MKTTHNTLTYLSLALSVALVGTSCTRGNDPDPVIPPSDGTTLTLNGGLGESAAENSVFVDLSADEPTAINRTSWNLGIYSGSEFRIILNSTSSSSTITVDKTDIKPVSACTINIDDL